MEKYYIVINEKYLKEIERIEQIEKDRRQFIQRFFSENNINGNEYYMGGNGCVNRPFTENSKSNINLRIMDTEENIERFGKEFKKDKVMGCLYMFKKSSPLLKKFQSECIRDQVIINIHNIRVGDYFKELSMGGYSSEQFKLDGKTYIKVSTNKYDTITPEYEGFEELKASEYYLSLEKLENMVLDDTE